jgi:predicted transglutaminase-like cysteine proteinase
MKILIALLIAVSLYADYATMDKINRVVNNSYKVMNEPVDVWLDYDEFKAIGGGDCEDFAIAKYTIATEMFGLDKGDFSFVIVNIPHMVLKYKDKTYDIYEGYEYKKVMELPYSFVEGKLKDEN